MINSIISAEMHKQISDALIEQMGLHFPIERKNDLERELNNAYKSLGLNELNDLIELIINNKLNRKDIENLACHLTIGETYFFREIKTLEVVEKEIIPLIVDKKKNFSRQLNIWSAGCSTGEEPYSIAIIMDKLKKELEGWDISIYATDINPNFIQKAKKGIYSQWSFRTTNDEIREKYFSVVEGNMYKINDNIRQKVKFSILNLAEENNELFNSGEFFDIIFCRNVMIYFNEGTRVKIINRFYNLLTDNGWLIVSATEASPTAFSQFRNVNFTNSIIYTKDKTFKALEAVKTNLLMSNKLNESKTIIKKGMPADKIDGRLTEKAKHKTDINVEDERIKEASELFANNSFKKVIDLLELMLKGNGHYKINETIKTINLLVKSYANNGQKDKAKEWCKELMQVDKTNYSVYYLYASLLNEEGLYEEAIIYLRKALYLEPDFIIGMFSIASCLKRIGKKEEASKHLNTVLLLINKLNDEDLIAESDGIKAFQMKEIIKSLLKEINN